MKNSRFVKREFISKIVIPLFFISVVLARTLMFHTIQSHASCISLEKEVHKVADKSVQVQGQKNKGMRETGNFDRTMKCLPITFLESQSNVERDL